MDAGSIAAVGGVLTGLGGCLAGGAMLLKARRELLKATKQINGTPQRVEYEARKRQAMERDMDTFAECMLVCVISLLQPTPTRDGLIHRLESMRDRLRRIDGE